MPRLFDILKGDHDDLGGREAKKIPQGSVKEDISLRLKFPRQIYSPGAIRKKSNDNSKSSKKLIKIVKKKSIDDVKKAGESYRHLFEAMEALLEKVKEEKYQQVGISQLYKIVDELTNQLILGNSLLENIAQEGSEEYYLPRHTTNVCILSLSIGLQMNFNKSKLHVLGMAAIFHDIGMLSFMHISKKSEKLSVDGYEEVRRHALKGAEIFSRIKQPPNILLSEIIEQHHERIDGGGYPCGVKGGSINAYAKIIGLADTYEAITHHRAYRQAKIAHQAIREITGPLKMFFEFEIIKAFLDKISIYPIGSFVKLNTQEVAKIISPNPNFPLQPVILILLDSDLKHTLKSRLLDLSNDNSIYIKEPISL